MYENLLHQKAALQLKSDIKNSLLPGALLFSGPERSGKLTCALETARILSCTKSPRAVWDCQCPSCVKNRAMTSGNLLLAGPRDSVPEIRACAETFLKAHGQNAPYRDATRYLFSRGVRKLTLRFNQVLWDGDDKIGKIASITSAIEEELEAVDFPRTLSDFSSLEKTVKNLIELSAELEGKFLYDSIPVNHIRNVSSWARMKSVEGKNTVIIENADRMLESVRNALLKILEEPPEGTVFILTSARKSAVMPTILSRVRDYSFSERSILQQREVIQKVYHAEDFSGGVEEFLQRYLPLSPSELKEKAFLFAREISLLKVPDVSSIIKECALFEPRSMLKIFLSEINSALRKLMYSAQGVDVLEQVKKAVLESYTNVSVYNQGVQASLENLVREMSRINRMNGNILKCAIM